MGWQWGGGGLTWDVSRSSWWSTLRVFVENSLLDCRYFSFSLHPSARGLALQNKAVHLACGWRGGSLDLEPLRWGQLERWPGVSQGGP